MVLWYRGVEVLWLETTYEDYNANKPQHHDTTTLQHKTCT